jgi:hypothetical protein
MGAIEKIDCNSLAHKTGFTKRKARKIHPKQLLQSLCATAFNSQLSLNILANQISLLNGKNVSKQALGKRFNNQCLDFISHALFATLNRVACTDQFINKDLFAAFKRVLVQDSTTLKLPDKLVDDFPGSKNQTGKKKAGIRLQAIYDLLHERFIDFDPAPFSRNDQAAACDILNYAGPGDLILRDLGYFTIKALSRMVSSQIYFLSRFRHDVIIIDPATKERLNLVEILKKQSSLDIDVLLGVKHQMPVRLIAVPVPEQIANERRRKAKNNRCASCCPTKEHLWLLGWQIMITNVDRACWRPEQAVKAYAARWRIEIIFKSWKSHFNMTSIPTGNRAYVLSCIMAKLLFITLFQTFYDKLNTYMVKKYGRYLSLLKLSSIMGSHGPLFFHTLARNQSLMDQILMSHCTYEKRNDRINYHQLIDSLS